MFGGLALILLMIGKGAKASGSYTNILQTFIPEWEGFRANPYWDVSRYSWGYGTKAPGPTGTITRDQAMQELIDHVQKDYEYLSQLIQTPLTANQWAAYLSFSYNVGQGNADNLIGYTNVQDLMGNINARKFTSLEDQWKSYIYVDGQRSDNLVKRRAAEWELWSS